MFSRVLQKIISWRPMKGRSILSVKKLIRDQDGVTAVEFGLIALPFFALLMAIIEAGLFFFVSQVFDSGAREASRLIRTGQLALNQGSFKAALCARINAGAPLFGGPECTGLIVDVRNLGAYISIEEIRGLEKPDASGNMPGKVVQSTCANNNVIVRAYYEWPSFANALAPVFSNLTNGNILLSSVSVFRNEPFAGCTLAE